MGENPAENLRKMRKNGLPEENMAKKRVDIAFSEWVKNGRMRVCEFLVIEKTRFFGLKKIVGNFTVATHVLRTCYAWSSSERCNCMNYYYLQLS